MSEFTQEQKTSLVEGILKLLEAEPPAVLEEVLALISHMPGHLASLKEPPLHIHGMFYVRGDALARISDFLAKRSVKVKLHSRYGQIGEPQQDPLHFGTAYYPDLTLPEGLSPSNVKPRSVRLDTASCLVNAVRVMARGDSTIHAKVDAQPIEASFLLTASDQNDGLSPTDHEFYLHSAIRVSSDINMMHGYSTFSIGDEVVDVLALTPEQEAQLRQTGKYIFQRLHAEKLSLMHASRKRQIFNILYPLMKASSTMATREVIEKHLTTDDASIGNHGPQLSRGGIPFNTRTDVIEYLVHAMATKLRIHVVIENYDLEWERQSAYCHRTQEIRLCYNDLTRTWIFGPTANYHDESSYCFTPELSAKILHMVLEKEDFTLPDDHPFNDIPLNEAVAVASFKDADHLLMWGPRTLAEPASAFQRLSETTLLRYYVKEKN